MIFRVDGKPVVAGPGVKVVVPAGVRHSFQNTGTDAAHLEVEAAPRCACANRSRKGAALARAEKLVTRIVIAPTVPEYGIARDDCEGLAAALREQGYTARLEKPDGRDEFRHLPPDIVEAAHDVAIFVGDQLAGEALGALVTLVVTSLRRKTKRRRPALIYGPRGEVLRRVELPI